MGERSSQMAKSLISFDRMEEKEVRLLLDADSLSSEEHKQTRKELSQIEGLKFLSIGPHAISAEIHGEYSDVLDTMN